MKSEEGNAVVEFIGVVVGMLIPVIFVATGCWNIAQAHMALRDAAVTSTRGFVLSKTRAEAQYRMNAIVNDVVATHGIAANRVGRTVTCSTNNCMALGNLVSVKLSYAVNFSVPIFGNFSVPISDSHMEQVDEFK